MWCDGHCHAHIGPTIPAMSGGASAGRVGEVEKSSSSLVNKWPAAAEERNIASDIMLYAEGRLPGIGLGVVAPLIQCPRSMGLKGAGP